VADPLVALSHQEHKRLALPPDPHAEIRQVHIPTGHLPIDGLQSRHADVGDSELGHFRLKSGSDIGCIQASYLEEL
jgi:hypothetical protein